MAGKGKRLRPHTLTTPKPLIPIAGKPIVQRLVEDIAKVTPEPIENIGFVIGDFGEEVEQQLHEIAKNAGAKARLFRQEEAMGTAHAVHCAAEILEGKVTVAFADTLFKAEFTLDTSQDGIIWVKEVDDPSAFGVVKVEQDGLISEFIEKPSEPVSKLAIIGIYYFSDGKVLREAIDDLIENKIMAGGEYQLTTALENMKAAGTQFSTGTVSEWLDCGNKNATVDSNSRYLSFLSDQSLVDQSATLENTVVVPPVYVGAEARIANTVLGPNVSVGAKTKIDGSVIKDSLIQNNTVLKNVNLSNSMVGNYVMMENSWHEVSLGDFIELKG